MPSCSAETHLFSSHPAIDASEASASRAWGPCRPVSPKDSIKASHETRNRPEECLGSAMAGRPRALFATFPRNATKRHHEHRREKLRKLAQRERRGKRREKEAGEREQSGCGLGSHPPPR